MEGKMKKTLTRLNIREYLIITCLGILLIAISGYGCSGKKNKPNIIILLLDCVRADHLSCYGYSRDTSPHIDALAAQGVKFSRAISQSPWTLVSVTSLLTGCYPHRHGVGLSRKKGRSLKHDKKNIKILGSGITVLPEILRQAGYKTWGFSTNLFVNNKNIGKRGFDEFKFRGRTPAEKVVDYGLKKIELARESGKPFFLYLHFMDAHEPLVPPKKYYNYFPTSDGKGNDKIHERWKFGKYEKQNGIAFKNFKEHKVSLYDGTIRYMDAEIGRLIKFLKSSGLMADTIIVVTSDHGEEFWDHADFEFAHYHDPRKVYGVGHGHTMFQELLWVPLVITNLNSTKRYGSDVQDTVQLIDVFPTLLNRINLKTNSDSDGMTLLPLVNFNKGRSSRSTSNTHSFSRAIVSESPAYGNLKISLIYPPFKFIYSYKETNVLFNLEKDPLEKKNLIKENPKLVSDMLKKIRSILNKKAAKTEKLSLSKEDIQVLRSLGYIN